MNLRAANEQRQEALWCVFLMFVVMALVIIRTGVVCRGLAAVVPCEEEAEDGAPAPDRGQPSPTSADLYRAVLAVLSLAEAAGRLLALEARTDWELMNQPLAGRRASGAWTSPTSANACGKASTRPDLRPAVGLFSNDWLDRGPP